MDAHRRRTRRLQPRTQQVPQLSEDFLSFFLGECRDCASHTPMKEPLNKKPDFTHFLISYTNWQEITNVNFKSFCALGA